MTSYTKPVSPRILIRPSSPTRKTKRRSRSNCLFSVAVMALALPPPPLARAYISGGLPAHTQRAFLRRLTDDICNTNPGTLTPMEVSCAPILMSAWANGEGTTGRERAMAVEGLLKRMIDERRAGNDEAIARTEDYNAVMKSWAMSGERSAAALRVEQILMNMQDMYASGDVDVQPNLESFQTAIEAWTRATDEPNALARARQILDWMSTIYLANSNDLAMPDTSCFKPILKCYAVSNKLEAPIVSEHLLMDMQRLQMEHGMQTAGPDTTCFNIVMSGWLKSGDVASERRIRQIFEYMDVCYQQTGRTDIRPDASTYNIVISSIAPAVKKRLDVGGALRADGVLARLEEAYLQSGKDVALRPDTIVYNQVIDYWAKTQTVDDHFLKSRGVLDRQVAMYKVHGVRKCRPDITGYTSVIGACASTSGSRHEKRRAFDVAHATFIESCKLKYTQPNDVTYGLMFKVVGRLLPEKEERDRYARTLFSLCKDDGCLGEMAYTRLTEAVTKEQLQELSGGRGYVDLPVEWKCNVKKHPRKSYESKFCNTQDKLRM